jgi:hypothetical protein
MINPLSFQRWHIFSCYFYPALCEPNSFAFHFFEFTVYTLVFFKFSQ